MNFKHKHYSIDTPSKLGKTGDYEPYLWYITNNTTNTKFTFITRTSGTRVVTKNLSDEETLLNDAWNFIKFYLDQGKEIEGFIIAINSNSELGVFYTPKPVVQCITDILVDIKNNEDQINHRWQSHKNKPRYPTIIDPACGEGIFLKQAIVQGLTHKQWIFGLDLDPEAVDKWETTNLLQEFEGNRKDLRSHFFHQNGLLPMQWSQHQQYYEGNINKKYLRNEKFDFVVGNPPYGGLGIYQEMKHLLDMFNINCKVAPDKTVINLGLFGEEKITTIKSKKTKENEILTKEKIKELLSLSKALLNYSIWKDPKNKSIKYNQTLTCNGFKVNYPDLLDEKEIERLKSFPIEVLFLEKFIKLAKLPHKNKNGGVIAVIIPDGILSNSTMDYVRQFVGSQTKVLGIISLPRGTFKEAKTNAKTSILLLEKTDNQSILQDYPVFLASIPEIKEEYFVTIKQYFTQFMTQQKTTQFIDETNGLMIRTDKTLKDLNTEKPSSRWDPDFWNPKYEIIFDKHTSEPLDKFITNITYGVILTGENRKFKDSGVHYISSTTVTETGINHFLNPLFVSLDDKRNNENKRPEYGDIIMNRSGVGTLGRQCVFIDRLKKYTISDDTDLIKIKNISPFYVSVFLLTNYGKKQIDRRLRGVSGLIKLSFDDIKAIKIPILTDTVIKTIDERYIEMAKLHESAIEAKAKGNENEYKENLTKAQELLRDLAIKTEAVIKGERENVD